jgi:hypothetical protein
VTGRWPALRPAASATGAHDRITFSLRPGADPPDVLATLPYGPTSFELARLNHPGHMQARNRQAPGQRLFQTAFDQLAGGRRAALAEKFARCAITISLTGDRKIGIATTR